MDDLEPLSNRISVLDRLDRGQRVSPYERRAVDNQSRSRLGEFSKGLRRFGYSAAATSEAFLGQMAEPFAPQFAKRRIAGAVETANSMPESLRAKVGSFQEARETGDYLPYAAGALGEGLGSVGTMLAAGLLSRGAAFRAAPAARNAAQFAGGTAAMLPMEGGETALNLQQNPEAMANTTAGQRAAMTLGRGAVNAALENVVPNAVFARQIAGKGARYAAGLRGAAEGIGRTTAAGVVGEGATEGAQDLTGQYVMNRAVPGTGYDFDATREAAIRGAITGGVLGGAGGTANAVYSNARAGYDASKDPGRKALNMTVDGIYDLINNPNAVGADVADMSLGALAAARTEIPEIAREARRLGLEGADITAETMQKAAGKLRKFVMDNVDPEQQAKWLEMTDNLREATMGEYRVWRHALEQETGKRLPRVVGWSADKTRKRAKGLGNWISELYQGAADEYRAQRGEARAAQFKFTDETIESFTPVFQSIDENLSTYLENASPEKRKEMNTALALITAIRPKIENQLEIKGSKWNRMLKRLGDETGETVDFYDLLPKLSLITDQIIQPDERIGTGATEAKSVLEGQIEGNTDDQVTDEIDGVTPEDQVTAAGDLTEEQMVGEGASYVTDADTGRALDIRDRREMEGRDRTAADAYPEPPDSPFTLGSFREILQDSNPDFRFGSLPKEKREAIKNNPRRFVPSIPVLMSSAQLSPQEIQAFLEDDAGKVTADGQGFQTEVSLLKISQMLSKEENKVRFRDYLPEFTEGLDDKNRQKEGRIRAGETLDILDKGFTIDPAEQPGLAASLGMDPNDGPIKVDVMLPENFISEYGNSLLFGWKKTPKGQKNKPELGSGRNFGVPQQKVSDRVYAENEAAESFTTAEEQAGEIGQEFDPTDERAQVRDDETYWDEQLGLREQTLRAEGRKDEGKGRALMNFPKQPTPKKQWDQAKSVTKKRAKVLDLLNNPTADLADVQKAQEALEKRYRKMVKLLAKKPDAVANSERYALKMMLKRMTKVREDREAALFNRVADQLRDRGGQQVTARETPVRGEEEPGRVELGPETVGGLGLEELNAVAENYAEEIKLLPKDKQEQLREILKLEREARKTTTPNQRNAARKLSLDELPDTWKGFAKDMQRMFGERFELELLEGASELTVAEYVPHPDGANPQEAIAKLQEKRAALRKKDKDDPEIAKINERIEMHRKREGTYAIFRIATGMNPPGSLAEHEAMHAAWKMIFQSKPEYKRTLATVATTGQSGRRMREFYKDDEAVMAVIDPTSKAYDPEEAAAYMFQLWSMDPSILKLGTKPQGVFQQVKQFFMRLLGMMTPEMKARIIMRDLKSGKLAKMTVPTAYERHMERQQRTVSGEITEGLGALASAAGGLYKKLLTSTYSQLESTENPALAQIARLGYTESGQEGEGYIQALRRNQTAYNNQASNEIFANFTEEQKIELVDALVMKERPTDEKLAAAYDANDKLMKDILAYQQAAGVDVNDAGDNYYPLAWDVDKVIENQNAFMEMMYKYEDQLREETGMSPEEVFESISSYEMRGESFSNILGANNEPSADHTKARVLSFIAPEDRRAFLNDDPTETILHYIAQATRNAEFVRAFGKNGETLNRLLDDAKREYAMTPAEEKLARDYVDGLMGNKEVGMSRELKDVYGAMIAYQNVRVLPFSAFSSLVDPISIAVRTQDAGAAWEGFTYATKNLFRDWTGRYSQNQWEQISQDIGTIEASGTPISVDARYTGVTLAGKSRKVNDTFFKMNLLNGLVRSHHVVATKRAAMYLHRSAEGFFGEADSQTNLQEAGVSAENVRYSEELERILISEKDFTDYADMSQEEAAAASAEIQKGLNKIVRQSLIQPSSAEMPGWMSNPYLAPIAHLKTFIFGFNKTVLQRIAYEAERGNYGPMYTAAAFVPGMMAADFLKDMVNTAMGDEPEYKRSWGLPDYFMHGVYRSGLTGTGQFFMDVREDMSRGGGGWESLAGPSAEQMKKLLRTTNESDWYDMWDFTVDSLPANGLYDQWVE